MALRSALLTAASYAAMVKRALTPLFLSTNSLVRASKETCSMSLFIKSLTSTLSFCAGKILASCSVMASEVSIVFG